MSALDARRRRPDEEALTHLHRMTDSLRRMVAASRVGSPEEEAHGSAHAVELHACNIAHAADELLALIHELRATAARNDLGAVDAEVSAALAAEADTRRGRAAARDARRDAPAADLPYVAPIDLAGAPGAADATPPVS